jgi:hypothetical protein
VTGNLQEAKITNINIIKTVKLLVNKLTSIEGSYKININQKFYKKAYIPYHVRDVNYSGFVAKLIIDKQPAQCGAAYLERIDYIWNADYNNNYLWYLYDQH